MPESPRSAPPHRHGRLSLLALATLATLAATACGGDADASDDGGAALVDAEADVSAIDNTFRPETLTVEAGTTVVFTNDGRTDHNVLPAEGDAWGVQEAGFAPDDVYSHRFTEPGTYDYYCSLHGTSTAGMIGTIEVTG